MLKEIKKSVVIFMALIGVGLASTGCNPQVEETQKDTITKTEAPVYNIYTIKHEDHKYVIHGQTIIHHPDCCQQGCDYEYC